MKFTEDNVLRVEHTLISNQLIWECPKEDCEKLLMYIAGVNDMANEVIEAMRVIKKM